MQMNPLKSAEITQRQLALETPCVEPCKLPDDLATLLILLGENPTFKIHGMVRINRSLPSYFYRGRRVDVSLVEVCAGLPKVAIRDFTGEYIGQAEAEKRGVRGMERVDPKSISTQYTNQEWWFASVEGNGITLEGLLKERGYPALATNMNLVAIRPV